MLNSSVIVRMGCQRGFIMFGGCAPVAAGEGELAQLDVGPRQYIRRFALQFMGSFQNPAITSAGFIVSAVEQIELGQARLEHQDRIVAPGHLPPNAFAKVVLTEVETGVAQKPERISMFRQNWIKLFRTSFCVLESRRRQLTSAL